MAMATGSRAEVRTREVTGRSRTIVVGFDGSEEARVALRAALERVRPGDRVHAIHAYAEISSWRGDPFYGRELSEAQQAARHILEQAEEITAQAPADVTFELHEGAPAEVLTRIAALRDADEVVVGTRGLGRIRGALGSVAQQVVRTADRPVLVVRARTA